MSQAKMESHQGPKPFVERFSLLFRTALVAEFEVHASECLSSVLVGPIVVLFPFLLCLGLQIEFLLIHRQTQIGCPLKDCEMTDYRANFMNALHTRGSSANDGDFLTLDIYIILWIYA
jgi:hypothetical protein